MQIFEDKTIWAVFFGQDRFPGHKGSAIYLYTAENVSRAFGLQSSSRVCTSVVGSGKAGISGGSVNTSAILLESLVGLMQESVFRLICAL